MRFVLLFLIFCAVSTAEIPGLAILNFETKKDVPFEKGIKLTETIYRYYSPKKFWILEKSQLRRFLGEKVANTVTILSQIEMEELTTLGVEFVMMGFIEKRDERYYGGWRLLEIRTGEICQEKQYIQGAKTYKEFLEIVKRSFLYLSKKGAHKTIEDLAEDISVSMGEKIKKMPLSSLPYRVAIFPFGNIKGEAGSAMGNLPTVLQAEIIRQLQFYLDWQAPKRFHVLDSKELKDCFKRHSVNPLGINIKYIDQSRRILSKAEIDIAILGQYKISNPSRISKEKIDVYVTGINLLENLTWSLSSEISCKVLEEHRVMKKSAPTTRFPIHIFVKIKPQAPDSDEKAWEERVLYRFKEESSPLYNSYCILLKERDLERKYKIVIQNLGTPSLNNLAHPLDQDRLFAISLLVDGVDSFYHKKKDIFVPTTVHPRKAKKWILTAPGRKIVMDSKGTKRILKERGKELSSLLKNIKLETILGKGNSEVEILGFQNGTEIPDSFVFFRPREALAEEIGITQKRGLITIYIYPERLPEINDTQEKNQMEIICPTTSLSFYTHVRPCEVISIVYRYEEDMFSSMDELEECSFTKKTETKIK